MLDSTLMPVNLAEFGINRATSEHVPDLITIWHTPYPMLRNYKKVCAMMKVEPFAGGTFKAQGSKYKPGFITSGYRSDIIEGRRRSPHLYALALDIAVGDLEEQIIWAKAADLFYTRVGLYPDNGFIHVDLMPKIWIQKYSGTKYWVRKSGLYKGFWNLDEAVTFAKAA